MAEPATITLANSGEPIRIPADRVYLAFPSGRFSYDCVACGAKCCRGFGYEVLAGAELDWQLGTQHAVRFFLEPCDSGADDHFHARNWKPSCFFLDRQGLCGIQTQHGFDAKPETCRLFPFNNLRRVGDYLIVGPHTGLCPLQVLPAGEHSDASDHGQLLASLEAVGIGTHVSVVDASGVDVSQLVALERRILETCERPTAGQTYASHAAGQLALTRLASGAAATEADARAAAEEEIDRFLRLVHEILGVAPPSTEAADLGLVNTMIGATPSIRSLLVFGGGMAGPGADRIPLLLLALYTFGVQAARAGMYDVTYQTLMELFQGYRPMLNLLADLSRVMVWRPGATIDFAVSARTDVQARYVAIAKALTPNMQRTARLPLGRVLMASLPADEMDRIVFLKLIARRVGGRLVPIERQGSLRDRLRQPRATALQWGVGHLSHDVLMVAAERANRKTGRRGAKQSASTSS